MTLLEELQRAYRELTRAEMRADALAAARGDARVVRDADQYVRVCEARVRDLEHARLRKERAS